jgi:hypothetical protein
MPGDIARMLGACQARTPPFANSSSHRSARGPRDRQPRSTAYHRATTLAGWTGADAPDRREARAIDKLTIDNSPIDSVPARYYISRMTDDPKPTISPEEMHRRRAHVQD